MGVALRAHDPVSGGTEEQPGVLAPACSPDLVAAYTRYSPQLFAYCMAILRHRDDAEDAVQETFARAAAQGDRLTGDLLPFLTTVARNVSIDMIRQRKRRGPEIDDEHPDHRRGPEPCAVDRFLVEQTWRMLSSRDRLLLAHSFAGFAYEEISRRTGLSAKSVSVGITRAREHSRKAAAAVASVVLPLGVRRLLMRGSRAAQANPHLAGAALTGFEQGSLLAATLIVGVVGTAAASAGGAPAHPALTAAVLSSDSSLALNQPTGGAPPTRVLAAQPPGTPSADRRLAGPATSPGTAVVGTALANVPGHSATQQDMLVYSMTASPSYAQDRTIYATGAVVAGCPVASGCPAVFRSQDGGTTWTQLAALGFAGGRVVLPASYPADPSIYVQGPTGLQRAAGDGSSFAPVVPGAVVAAAVPGAPPSGTEIALASTSIEVYSAQTGLVTPGAALPAGYVANDIAFTDATHMLVTAYRQSPGMDGIVLVCTLGGTCQQTAEYPAELSIGATPLTPGSALTAVYSAEHLYVSRDGGASFATAPLPAGVGVSAVSVGPGPSGAGVLGVATFGYDATGAARSAVYTSSDAARFAEVAALPAPRVELDTLLLLPGRMLAGLAAFDGEDHVGVRCSTDAGRSWRSSC